MTKYGDANASSLDSTSGLRLCFRAVRGSDLHASDARKRASLSSVRPMDDCLFRIHGIRGNRPETVGCSRRRAQRNVLHFGKYWLLFQLTYDPILKVILTDREKYIQGQKDTFRATAFESRKP
jgi:hypothetical protein